MLGNTKMLFITKDSVSPTLKVTIIGAGLAGLATLVRLINRSRGHSKINFEIDMIEKRDLNFNRGQKISTHLLASYFF